MKWLSPIPKSLAKTQWFINAQLVEEVRISNKFAIWQASEKARKEGKTIEEALVELVPSEKDREHILMYLPGFMEHEFYDRELIPFLLAELDDFIVAYSAISGKPRGDIEKEVKDLLGDVILSALETHRKEFGLITRYILKIAKTILHGKIRDYELKIIEKPYEKYIIGLSTLFEKIRDEVFVKRSQPGMESILAGAGFKDLEVDSILDFLNIIKGRLSSEGRRILEILFKAGYDHLEQIMKEFNVDEDTARKMIDETISDIVSIVRASQTLLFQKLEEKGIRVLLPEEVKKLLE